MGENVLRLTIEPVFVEKEAEAPPRLAADKNILSDGQMVHQLKFLMNDADPHGLRVAWAGKGHRLAVVKNLAAVLRVHAGEDFHQR